MMNAGWKRWASLVAAGALGAAALTACGSGRSATVDAGGTAGGSSDSAACSPGVTDTEIKIGQSSLQSGPGAAYKALVDGARAVFDEVNESGGVTMGDGKTRKIDYISLDDGYDPARAVVNVKQLVEQDQVAAFFGNTGTSAILAYIDYTTDKGVPLILPAGSPPAELVDRYRDGTAMLALYTNATVDFENVVRVKAIAADNPDAKIAVLYSNEETGKTQLEAFQQAMAGTGLEIVAEESYEVTAPSIDSQITNLRGSDADTFAMLGSGSFITMALKKIEELDWHPEKWITAANPSVDLITPAGPGATDDVKSIAWGKGAGMIGLDTDPAVIEYGQWATENGYDPTDDLFMAGTVSARTFLQVLEATDGCTGEAIFDAAKTAELDTGWSLPGVTYASTDDNPSYVNQAVVVAFDPAQNGWVVGTEVYSADD
ncbi:ABC transporter substrate-binding protein [Nakamurella leprariae]|uniref:ABC transporter substrate-binding protein n=1 Tax=Nakamurella leprariae TaxID=2803911 RepID=A0A938YDZ2_9ACTN|nr:ABC transporter substrate-binding protein [Nakamurella leprariae]MBM9467818.1 ABC transporter substrate-binding protein [Nakamurella leprariae]